MKAESVLLHVPHASLALPRDLLGSLRVPYEAVQHQALRQADLYCDELFAFGYQTVTADYSRFICDVERFKDDALEPMAKRGQGMFYTHFEDGACFRGSETRERVEREVYDTHHARLTSAANRALEKRGRCLIVDCHSFALPGDQPDICIGSDGFHTPAALEEYAADFVREAGYTVTVNAPYSGSIVPLEYYGKDQRVRSIMIELNRRLYMTEGFEKSGGFDQTRRFCEAFLKNIAAFGDSSQEETR